MNHFIMVNRAIINVSAVAQVDRDYAGVTLWLIGSHSDDLQLTFSDGEADALWAYFTGIAQDLMEAEDDA